MTDPVQGHGPINPQSGSFDPKQFSQLQQHLRTLSDLFMKLSADGNLSDDDHFCHQVALSVTQATEGSKGLATNSDESVQEVAQNTFHIMTQTLVTDLGKTSLEKAAKEYEEGKSELMHQVMSTFANHPSATQTLGQELSLIAHS